MSRTHNGKRTNKAFRPGWEGYDSPRPMRWSGFGKQVKKICHGIERANELQEIKAIAAQADI